MYEKIKKSEFLRKMIHKIFPFTICIFISQFSIAQKSLDSLRFEFGGGLPYFPGIFESPTIPVNITAKYYIKNQKYLRCGLNVLSPLFDLSNRKELVFNVGFEKRYGDKKTRFYFGIDVGLYLKDFNISDSSLYSFPYKLKKIHIGAGFVIGGEYRITNEWSVQSELAAIYGYGKENIVLNNGNEIIKAKGELYTATRVFSVILIYKIY